jgi:exodeoxyribonuclease VIII
MSGAVVKYIIPDPKDFLVWGNGADFDLPILSAAYVAAGFGGPPWKPYNGRCYRTLKNLRPDVPRPERRGTAHNALDDAVFQAEHAIALLAALRA